MWKNYLKIAYRNLRRNKSYAAINVGGLALGLATFLVIALYVQHELSYDRFHRGSDQLHRVLQETEDGYRAINAPGTEQAMESLFPEVKHATLVQDEGQKVFSRGGEDFYIDRALTTDRHFFDVFSFHLVQGNPETALNGLGKMVLTQSQARKLFPDENPVGKTVTFETNVRFEEEKYEYEVTGVVEDPPPNSHFQFNVLLSLLEDQRPNRYTDTIAWNFVSGYTYLRLHEGADPEALQGKIDAYFAKQKEKSSGLQGQPITGLQLQRVTDIHLSGKHVVAEISPQGDVRYLYLFSAVALLILLIACINYTNLATARSAKRAREVGVRKVVGAHRRQLIGQFLGEALLITAIALPLAIGMTQLALPFVEQVAGRELTLYYDGTGTVLATLLGIALVVGVVSGSYPALVLSLHRPAGVLKGSAATAGRRGNRVQKGLVVFQFAASIVLIVGTLVVEQQLGFIQSKNLGFDQEQVLTFRSNPLGQDYRTFKQELEKKADILSVSSGLPLGIGMNAGRVPVVDEATGTENQLTVNWVDYDYLETMGLALKTGRSFSRDFATDEKGAVILNETATQQLGLTGDPIGETIGLGRQDMVVIGVVEDFHNGSLHEPIEAVAFVLFPSNNFYALVRVRAGGIEGAVSATEETWRDFQPDHPFSYEFLDDRIQAQYQSEQQTGRIFSVFAGLAVFLACLGLFGLGAYATEQRTKEIGIRKVFGASIGNIVALLSKDFLWLVLASFAIAVPVAYYAMSQWLQEFAYRIELGPWLFVGAGALALVIAMTTVTYQAIRTALMCPADTLRYD